MVLLALQTEHASGGGCAWGRLDEAALGLQQEARHPALQLCPHHKIGRQCPLAAALSCPHAVVDTLCCAHLLQASRPALLPKEGCS